METKHSITILFSLLFLFPSKMTAFKPNSTNANPENKPQPAKVVVEGMVYCQCCSKNGTWSLTGAKPIPSAKISVICKNFKKQVSFYKVYETNAKGYFFALLDGYKMINPILDHPLISCKVRLVSSPLETCNLLTNINYGLYGSRLRYENKVLFGRKYEVVVYSSGPLAFRPPRCLPPTHG